MARSHFDLTYALKNGEIVGIEDVERGLQCNCICPACGKDLIAKKGNKREHHFAHRNGANCEYGYQTSLHFVAKDILMKARKIVLPPVVLSFPGSPKNARISNSITLDFDSVKLEKSFGAIVPDIIISKGKRKLFVEIYVTHRIDDAKLEKLKNVGISTIEIDLSKTDRGISRTQLTDILLRNRYEKKWIYNRKCEEWRKRFYEKSDRMRIISRGLAYHVDWCPIKARIWKGKPYANVIDDCSYCKYNIGEVLNDQDEKEYLYCTGRNKISEIEDFDCHIEEK